ncbi:MAG: post-PEP-CTERM-1 domain-containing protein [Bryobacteraceae bacterium]
MSARFECKAWAAVVCLIAIGTPSLAAQEKKPAAEKKADKQTEPAAGGMKAYIDPATGKLREPTPEDLRTEGPGPQARPESDLQILRHPGGAVSVVLGPEHMSYSVAKRNEDGTLSMSCVEGEKKAESWMKEFKKPVDLTLSKEKLDVK